MINRGLRRRRSVGDRPRRSSTPGRKGSIKMSARQFPSPPPPPPLPAFEAQLERRTGEHLHPTFEHFGIGRSGERRVLINSTPEVDFRDNAIERFPLQLVLSIVLKLRRGGRRGDYRVKTSGLKLVFNLSTLTTSAPKSANTTVDPFLSCGVGGRELITYFR